MSDIRLKGALMTVWLLFVIVAAFGSLLSPGGFSLAVQFRSGFETMIGAVLYVPPLVFLYWILGEPKRSGTEDMTALKVSGWVFVVLVGTLLAAMLVSILGYIGFAN